VWRLRERSVSGELSPAVCRWLLDDGSLTGRLIEQGRGPFRVSRLSQGWEVPLPSEQRLLDVPDRQVAIVREVALLQGECTVVFARSVIPIASLGGNLAHLRRLQNRPLGAILFGNAAMRRSPFELACIAGDSDYLPPVLRQDSDAWARRSLFSIAGKKLMVSEVFLEGFRPWSGVLPVHRTQRGKVRAAIVRAKQ
jgi:chorismate--pyruvate lyase